MIAYLQVHGAEGLVADQPIQVAGIEFIADTRTEAVLAVDLVDADSIPGLKEKPLRRWTTKVVSRNLAGISIQGVASLVVAIVLVGAGSDG